jgi:hypothetical protein
MKQSGRKSAGLVAAEMRVIDTRFEKRAEPPAGMPERQVAIWRDTVKSEPPKLFSTGATRGMLQAYCRHRAIADEMSELIEAFDPAWLAEAKGQRRYEWLTKMVRVETKAAMEIATKLRLTNQSRWQSTTTTLAAEKVTNETGSDDISPWSHAHRA